MTNIAWDGHILAADSQITQGAHVYGRESKIYIANNIAISASGPDVDCESFINWVKTDKSKAHVPFPKMGKLFQGILMFPTGISKEEYRPGIYLLSTGCKGVGEYIRLPEVWGAEAGTHFIRGAMYAGKNAHEALDLACDYSIYTGRPVYSITLKQLAALPSDFVGLWEHTYADRVGGAKAVRKRNRR